MMQQFLSGNVPSKLLAIIVTKKEKTKRNQDKLSVLFSAFGEAMVSAQINKKWKKTIKH